MANAANQGRQDGGVPLRLPGSSKREDPLLLGLIGRAMKAVAQLRSGDERADLAHVGDELVRLDRGRPQEPATSR